MRGLLRFAADERGNVAILFAILLSLGTVVGALAVDEGSLYLQRRNLQAAVDLAAIAAAPAPAAGFDRARQLLADAGLVDPGLSDAALANGTTGVGLGVVAGTYTPDPARAPADRFVAGGGSPNAVRVQAYLPGRLYFAQSWARTPAIGATAIAATTPTVMFSIGATLAKLADGVPNAVLNALLGTDVQLAAVSYDGLATAQVDLFGFLDALAQRLDIRVGTYGDVLKASASAGAIARALADSLSGADAAAASALAAGIGNGANVPLGKLFDLGRAAGLAIGTGSKGGDLASVSALELLAASAAVSDGTHQVALNLGANVPGLTSLTMRLAVGEPPQFAAWFALGPDGTIVRTAQVRLSFVATLAGGAALLNAGIRVPLYLEVANAEAAVTAATCPVNGAASGTATIAVTPGVARLRLGEVDAAALGDFAASPTITPAMLINLLLLKVSGSGVAEIAQLHPAPLSFSSADIAAGTAKETSTTSVTQSLTQSLLASPSLQVSALGLGLPSTAVIQATVAHLLAPLGPVLDSTIAATLETLGLKLGAADVRVYRVTCEHAVLVG